MEAAARAMMSCFFMMIIGLGVRLLWEPKSVGGQGDVLAIVDPAFEGGGLDGDNMAANKEVIGPARAVVGIGGTGPMPVGLDVIEDGFPTFRPVSGMGVVVVDAGVLGVGDLEDADGLGGIPDQVETAEGFQGAPKAIDAVDGEVLVGDVAGSVVGETGAALGIGGTDPDGSDVSDVGGEGEDPGSVGGGGAVGGLGEEPVEVLAVHLDAETDLTEIGDAGGLTGAGLGGGEGGEEHAGEDGDDGDDDQEFDEGKGAVARDGSLDGGPEPGGVEECLQSDCN